MGMGGPLLNVTTSLASAINEYHRNMIEVWAMSENHWEGLAHEARPKDLITQTEAAKLANVTPQAINNAIRDRRLRSYSDENAVSHKPGDTRVSEAEVRRLWPPKE